MFQKYYNSSCLKHPFWAKPKCVSDEIFTQPALLYFLLFTLLHFYSLTLSSSSQGRQCVTDVSRAPLRLCSVLPCRLATNHPLPECQSATMIPQSHHFLTSWDKYLQPHPARVPLHSAVVCSSWRFQRPSRIAKANPQIWKGDHMLAPIGVDRWVHFNSNSLIKRIKFILILHFYALCSFHAGDYESIPWLIIICVDRNKKEFPVIVVIGRIKIYTNVIVIFIITFIVIGIGEHLT